MNNTEILALMESRRPGYLKGIEFTDIDAEDVELLVVNNGYNYDEAIEIIFKGIAYCLDCG